MRSVDFVTNILLKIYIYIYLARGEDSNTIIFSAISNLDSGTSGKATVGAQWLAIQEINNNTNLLPNYTLTLEGLYANSTVHLDWF